MIEYLKLEKTTFYQKELYGFKEMNNNLYVIRCAIKFYINFVSKYFMHRQFFAVQK
jgi:hypothetical protein